MSDPLSNINTQSDSSSYAQPADSMQEQQGKTATNTNEAMLPAEPDIDALLDIADEVAITWVREQSQLDEVIDALETCGWHLILNLSSVILIIRAWP